MHSEQGPSELPSVGLLTAASIMLPAKISPHHPVAEYVVSSALLAEYSIRPAEVAIRSRTADVLSGVGFFLKTVIIWIPFEIVSGGPYWLWLQADGNAQCP